jgi:uncharacterized protein
MAYLIDGNNLMHALAEAGLAAERAGLTKLLAELAWSHQPHERVHVIFDGPEPGPLDPPLDARVDATFSHQRTADELIAEQVLASTAPHRLTVVSGDHAVQREAHKRRCRVVSSDDFDYFLLRNRRHPNQPKAEPPEKDQGLTPEESEAWIKELNVEELEKKEEWP